MLLVYKGVIYLSLKIKAVWACMHNGALAVSLAMPSALATPSAPATSSAFSVVLALSLGAVLALAACTTGVGVALELHDCVE